ncbi:restriction endonuclease subunit S [Yersinia enterocolitica]|uniref:restriction endonuclease subunit S n=1 Tax=Yersinia TaxID=629 RepID=UPI003AB7B90B
MSCNWRIRKLGDLVTFMSGGTPSKSNKDYWDGEIPWISASSMQSTRYSDSDLLVTEKGSHNGTRLVPKDTVLLLVRGSALHNKIPVGITTREVTFNQDVKALIPKTPEITPFYLLSWLISIKGLLLTKVENTGIGAGKLDTKILQDLDMPIPPNDELLRLESFCKALDEKIILNEAINQTLEQIAQTLFKSWFVDFEPVKAKIAVLEAGGSQEEATLAAMTAISGKDADSLAVFEREYPEQYAELKAMAELFPSAMQDSELGEIPEGWNVCNIKSSVTELRRGISPKYTEETDGVIVINQKCIRNHTINFSLARLHDSKKRTISGRELQVGDVLVNSTGTGTLGRLAPIRYLAETVIADSHVTVVRADTAKITASYLSGLLMKYEQFIESNGSGSTGQTELRKEVLEEIYFPCPQLILGQLFDKFTSRLNEKFSLLEQQITVLSQLRDTLLPRLLSGEITLPEAETWAAQVDTQEA